MSWRVSRRFLNNGGCDQHSIDDLLGVLKLGAMEPGVVRHEQRQGGGQEVGCISDENIAACDSPLPELRRSMAYLVLSSLAPLNLAQNDTSSGREVDGRWTGGGVRVGHISRDRPLVGRHKHTRSVDDLLGLREIGVHEAGAERHDE